MNGDRHDNAVIARYLRAIARGDDAMPQPKDHALPIPSPVVQPCAGDPLDLYDVPTAAEDSAAYIESGEGWAEDVEPFVVDESDPALTEPEPEPEPDHRARAEAAAAESAEAYEAHRSSAVADLPDENGAEVNDHADDGFIPGTGEVAHTVKRRKGRGK